MMYTFFMEWHDQEKDLHILTFIHISQDSIPEMKRLAMLWMHNWSTDIIVCQCCSSVSVWHPFNATDTPVLLIDAFLYFKFIFYCVYATNKQEW